MTTVVWSERTRLHEPQGEVWVGVPTLGSEVPQRVDRIVDALRADGLELIDSVSHDDGVLTRVHRPEFVAHLESIHAEWMASEIPELVGQDRVVPYMFATEAMLGGLPGRIPRATHAKAGLYCYDTMTLVGPGTWQAARAAVDCALTAVDLTLAGTWSAYALCRPPGHHVTQAAYGGSCYLNNAAVAAQALREGGHDRVAVVDIDAHHGNGTAAIFYDRADIFYGSVHIDPGSGWFPHVVGYADETGVAEGAGTTVNVPLGPETGDDRWLVGVELLARTVQSFGATALVVSLGVDAADEDPESPLRVSRDGYREAGRLLSDLGLPTVSIQEGGYHLPSLGGLVSAFLSVFAAGHG